MAKVMGYDCGDCNDGDEHNDGDDYNDEGVGATMVAMATTRAMGQRW